MTTPAEPIPHAGQHDGVIERVLERRNLPTLPSVAAELLELTRDDSATPEDIARCVEVDQALAAKILKTINSSFYGLATPCPTISRAIGYLGMNSVRSLVLSFSLVEAFDEAGRGGGFDMAAHWRRAVYGAVAARLAAPRFKWCDPDEAFIGAMLRDVGALGGAIALEEEYAEVLRETGGSHTVLAPTERAALGVDHAAIGAALAGSWRIPPALVESIRRHHAEPASLAGGDPGESLCRCVAFASVAASACSENEEDARLGAPAFRGLCEEWLGLDRDGIAAFAEDLRTGGSEVTRLFEVDTGSPLDPSSILEGAEERKLEIQLTQDRENRRLIAQNTELQRAQRTDGLTGAGNRAAFDGALSAAFATAQRDGAPLAVLFVDADRFKTLNDTHGHQAGDEVLIELSRRLCGVLPGDGESPEGVFRYGGEEFAVIAPGRAVDEAADLGERLRRSIAEAPFSLPGGPGAEPLGVTVSVGVAVYDEATSGTLTHAHALLKAADDAVYEAKRGGRNVTNLYNHHGAAAERAEEAESAAPEPPEAEPSPAPGRGVDLAGGPAAEAQPQAEAGGEARGTVGSDAKPALRVLVVDDDPMLQKLLQTALERSGAEVRTEASVTKAVKLLHFGVDGQRFVPHVIITDLKMPGHSGTKLLRFIRATHGLSTAPVIVLSGSEQESDVRACLLAGASAYIPKSAVSEDPFDAARKLVEFWSFAVRAA